ncbi:SDR family NAD(P)-dependent oxidoreductase [Pandoraea sp. XJJ-1]|uniref:SDR family NAD(P)-dependent oxidoreductase n=1 Tax=Pandoraea sp. XJJ-1 TaxID=3002643 RepID=UPI0022820231|nr:SDR family NAD(P)-dependent oxidoreductase [Pandoraea sp. XJJ-1]WAL81830.1 SDR family NAD(P)-dependent oxidoreductase [Pandoraea sp. XJJ-1]
MNLSFEHQVVAVSGAAIGFGRVIAQTFASLGAHVYACDIREEALETLTSPRIDTRVVDLTDRSAATGWIGHIESQQGRAIDVLINNAGGVAGQAPRALESVTDAEWDRVVEINLGSTFALSRAVAAGMKRAGRGAIVNISSGAALQASLTGVQAYCAAKHAVLGLTRQLAHELGPFGIRVNSVAPGFVRTNEATEKQWAAMGEVKQKTLLDGIALRRFGTADDITRAVIFFASELSGFVNGQILCVDGGR